MMTKHYCKSCYKGVVAPLASDKHLLMTSEKMLCPCCGRTDYLVAAHFSWGEHTVTDDGKHVVAAARHVGVNPNYSFFENSYPYADVENFHS